MATRPIVLAGWQRVVCATFAFSVTGTGAYATLYVGNQGGSVALILLGGLGLLVALTGRVPERIGRDGVMYDAIGEQAKQELAEVMVDEQIPVESRARVAERVLEHQGLSLENVSSPAPFGALQRSIHAALFEAAVLEQLKVLRLPDDAELATEYFVQMPDYRHVVDAVVRRGGELLPNRMIAVEIGYSIARNEALERINRLRLVGFEYFVLIVPRRRSPMTVKSDQIRIVEFGEIGQNTADLTNAEVSALEGALAELWSQLLRDS